MMSKKRANISTTTKALEKKAKPIDNRSLKQKSVQFSSVTLNTHKNGNQISVHKNSTHRVNDSKNNNNLSELREEIQLLRMENQSLREELRISKNGENELKYRIRKLQRDNSLQLEMNATIENEYKKMEDKLQKYSEKIKELFQNLIHEKRRNAGLNPPPNISNSLNLRKLEQHGELDYLNSTTHLHHREGHNRIKFSHEQSLEQKSCGVETFENSPSLRKGMEGGDAVYASRC